MPSVHDPLVEDPYLGCVVGGRFVVGEYLMSGTSSRIYRAHDRVFGRMVALKLGHRLHPHSVVAHLRREARRLARFRHRGIVKVFDWGTFGAVDYLVLELLDGETLDRRLARGRLSSTRAIAIAHALADALAHVHEHGLVHRDVRPWNVFLARTPAGERVKLIDFGYAADRSDDAAYLVAGSPETPCGRQLGELARLPAHVTTDPRHDVFCVGEVLHQMLTVEPQLLDRWEPSNWGREQFRASPRRLAAQLADQPHAAALQRIVLRCLAPNPSHRYRSATDLTTTLKKTL